MIQRGEEVSDTVGGSVPQMDRGSDDADTNAQWGHARIDHLTPMAKSMGCRASAGEAGDQHVATVVGRRG